MYIVIHAAVAYSSLRDVPVKKISLEKNLYFSKGSMDLGITSRICTCENSTRTTYSANFIATTDMVQ